MVICSQATTQIRTLERSQLTPSISPHPALKTACGMPMLEMFTAGLGLARLGRCSSENRVAKPSPTLRVRLAPPFTTVLLSWWTWREQWRVENHSCSDMVYNLVVSRCIACIAWATSLIFTGNGEAASDTVCFSWLQKWMSRPFCEMHPEAKHLQNCDVSECVRPALVLDAPMLPHAPCTNLLHVYYGCTWSATFSSVVQSKYGRMWIWLTSETWLMMSGCSYSRALWSILALLSLPFFSIVYSIGMNWAPSRHSL